MAQLTIQPGHVLQATDFSLVEKAITGEQAPQNNPPTTTIQAQGNSTAQAMGNHRQETIRRRPPTQIQLL